MAAPLELFCWKGDWGLPSVDIECLIVLAYAKFAGAPLKVFKFANPWRSPTGSFPVLRTAEKGIFSLPSQIIIHLRKEKYNADYDLSAKEGADTLAFISLLEEKLLPALIYTLWLDPKNYVEMTRVWLGKNMPFPFNFFLPSRIQAQKLERLRMVRGDISLEPGEELESELFREAVECLNLLSQRLASHKFFFGDSPSSLDAYVFGHLAPLLKVKLPNRKLQHHLKSMNNLCNFCSHILSLYFPVETHGAGDSPSHKASPPPEPTDFDNEPNKRRNQVLSVLVAVGAMLSYALITGLLSLRQVHSQGVQGSTRRLTVAPHEEEEEEED